MIPVRQTRFGAPHGNCIEACIASLLEIPLFHVEQYPLTKFRSYQHYINSINDLLGHFDRFIYVVKFKPPFIPKFRGHYMVAGVKYTGDRHCVIYKNGRPCFDPNPDDAFLVEADRIYLVYKKPLKILAPFLTKIREIK